MKSNPSPYAPWLKAGRFLASYGWFYFIVLAGIYLSIAAITAIPELREAPVIPEEISVERLRASLNATLKESETRLGSALDDPRATAQPAASPAPAPGVAGNPTPAARLQASLLSTLRRERESMVIRWHARRVADLAHRRQAIEAAVHAYESQATRPGTRERREHFLQIVRWFNQGSNALDARLEELLPRVHELDREIAAVMEANADEDVKQLSEARKKRAMRDANEDLFGPMPRFVQAPDRAALGERYDGFFGNVARWLMKTESLELALITGLLGFGLLGAATSSFVRETRTGSSSETAVNNFTTLILSGVAAAFAIFLAVKGGLAVLSSTEAEPNPYVLLLTCFVAAVYREDAWARVRRIVGQEPDEEDEDADQARDAGAPAQPNPQAPGGGAPEPARDEAPAAEPAAEPAPEGEPGKVPAMAIHRDPAEDPAEEPAKDPAAPAAVG